MCLPESSPVLLLSLPVRALQQSPAALQRNLVKPHQEVHPYLILKWNLDTYLKWNLGTYLDTYLKWNPSP
ncbi:unnamed protein product [Merluccius merluccius]